MLKLICKILFLFSLSVEMSAQGTDWPLFRGNGDLTGRYEGEFPRSPRLLWSNSTAARTKSSPVVSGGTVYFGNEKGYLYAIGSDGKIKWKYEAGSPIQTPPMVVGEKVIFGADDGILRAVDSRSGRFIWSYKTFDKIVGSANAWYSNGRNSIVFGSYDFFLHCVNSETGKLLWKIETENYVNGTPAIKDGRIVFGGCDGMLRIVDPSAGKELYSIKIGVYIAASPALAGESAYFGDYDGNIYSVNLKSKKIDWQVKSEGEGAIISVPAISNNFVLVGCEDNNLYCYNAKNGKLIWKYRSTDQIKGSAVISSSGVLSAGTDGIVNLFRLSDGMKEWSFNVGTAVSSSPAMSGNCFYILTEDGRLMAFGNQTISK